MLAWAYWGSISTLQGQQHKIDSLLTAISHHATTQDSIKTAKSLLQAYFYQGNYGDALKYSQMALVLSKKSDDLGQIAKAYNGLGIVYRNLQMLEDATEALEQAKSYFQQLDDLDGENLVNNNLGLVVWGLKDYDKAIAYFRDVLAHDKSLEERLYGAGAMQNMALVYIDQGKYTLADTMCARAIKIYRAFDKQWFIATSLLNRALACKKKKQYDRAFEYIRQAQEIAQEIKAPELTMDCYQANALLNQQTGAYKEAITYFHQYYDLRDSLYSHEKNLEIERLKEEFESDQKDQENAMLESKNSRLSLLRNLLIIGFVMISIFSAILYYSLKLRQKANKQLRLKTEELTRAKNEAERATRAKADFLSIMSHEIRTPLNGVIGLANHLLDSNPRADQTNDLTTLRFSAKNLLTILNDILDFSRSEAEKITLESVDFDLSTLTDNLVRTHQAAAEGKGIALTFEASNAPKHVKGDPTRLGQVLNNLLSNAIKFTAEGSVTLAVTSGQTPDMVHFSVIDTGIGLSEAQQQVIFDEFSQASPDISRRYGGTGLGLAISKRLVHLMDSQIRLTSQEGKGSCFEFEVLLPTVSPPHQTLDTLNTQPSLEGLHVLLAEDNRINQIVVKKFLQRWGIHLDIVVNGKEALEKVQNHLYDLVLMDIHMPEMDGREATRLIRTLSSPLHAQTPVIALTASVLQLDNHWLTEAGLDGFVMKPFEPEDLRAAIEEFARR